MDRKMKILILGAGSVGSLIGGWLSRSHLADVILVGRNPHIEITNNQGLIVEFLDHKEVIKIKGFVNLKEVPVKPDLVILTTLTYQTSQALQELVNAFGIVTILTFQNGYPEEDISRVVTENSTLGGTTVINAKLIAPGHVKQSNSAPFIIGELSGEVTDRIKALQFLFKDAGMECLVSTNIQGEIWGKMIVNANSNTITGATNLTVRGMYESEHTRRFSYGLVMESFLVAKAAGINLDNLLSPLARELQEAVQSPVSWNEFSLNKAKTMQDYKLSMCALLERGVKTEVDYTNGFISAKAKQYWTRAPHHEAITRIIHNIEQGSMKPSPDNLKGSFILA